jgi:hypothetical protein
VVLGVVFSSVLFWRLPDGFGHVNAAVVLTLAVTTWLVYIFDRLLDLRTHPSDYSERHTFHFTNQYILSVLCVVLAIIAAVLCFFLPFRIFKAGLILVFLLSAYLFLLNKIFGRTVIQWLKEPVTAIFYTAAVVGMVFVELPSVLLSSWVLAIMFFFIVSQNLLLFSWFELQQKREVINSVSYFGLKRTRSIIRGLALINIVVFILFFSGGSGYVNLAAFTLVFASVYLSFLTVFPDYFLHKNKYRWLGDAVFLFPAWLLFF